MKYTPCALLRHKPFRAGYVCLVCNPDHDRQRLAQLLVAPGMQEYHTALVAGTECHALKCQRPGIHDDGLEHWWCEEHVFQCLFLQEGARRDFPAWEHSPGHTIQEGRPAWYKNAVTSADIHYKLALLLDVPVAELLAAHSSVVAIEPEPVKIPEPVQLPAVLVEEEEEMDLSYVVF